MRLKVELIPQRIPFSLPLAYNHHLASFIYHCLSLTSPSSSLFLHKEGYQSSKRSFKFFTFSQLLIPERRIQGERIIGRSSLIFLLSSPIAEFVENFVAGLLKQSEVKLCEEIFSLSQVEVLPEPEFEDEMAFSCLSPLVVSQEIKKGRRLLAEYISFDDPEFSEAIRKNLFQKYTVLRGSAPSNSSLEFEFDPDYIKRRGEDVYRLVNYKGTKIKGIMAPFRVRGDVELIQLVYKAGFGEKNSLGFGMAEVASSSLKI